MIEQIAIACKNPEETKKWLMTVLGANEWHEDLVVAEGQVFPNKNPLETNKNKAELNFNYQLGPFEFELIHYQAGKNWLQDVNTREDNFLSHFGFHIDDPERFEKVYENMKASFNIAQEVRTKDHTNEAIKNERRYRYVIFDTRDKLGFDLKIIQRLTLDNAPYRKNSDDRMAELEKKMRELEKQMIAMEMEYDELKKQRSMN